MKETQSDFELSADIVEIQASYEKLERVYERTTIFAILAVLMVIVGPRHYYGSLDGAQGMFVWIYFSILDLWAIYPLRNISMFLGKKICQIKGTNELAHLSRDRFYWIDYLFVLTLSIGFIVIFYLYSELK
jgi:hypothetical protein